MASSTSITTTTTTGTTDRRICTSCNTDVTPNATAGPLCPHCNSTLPSTTIPNPNHTDQFQTPSIVDQSIPTTTSDSTLTSSDDNFLLDSAYLHRLIHHITHNSSPSATTSRYHSPTSKSAIDAIPMFKITSEFLHIDPIVLCAVCKDQFVIDEDTKKLPCTHMYHPDCILPWLSQHSSCPVCRFELPKESDFRSVKVRRRSRSRVLRFGSFTEDVDDEAMLGIGFSNLHQQYLQSETRSLDMVPFNHVEQSVQVELLPDSDQTGRPENVSGWPNWDLNRRVVDGGNESNDGWIDDADIVMP